jgi:NAD(P)-dependent dehydrogenase (short-subunit alcohol dehydrogenase family)
MSDRVKKLLDEAKGFDKLAAGHLLGIGLPVHMANTAVFLASDEAEITTGQILVVDSGATIT